MTSLGRLLGSIVRGAAFAAQAKSLRERTKAGMARAARRAALLLTGALLLCLGGAFLLAAVYMLLSGWVGPIAASLLFGVVLVSGGLLLWLAASSRPDKAEDRSTAPHSTGQQLGEIGSSLQKLQRDVVRFAGDNPGLLIGGAFLLGLLSGRRNRSRQDD